MSEDVIVPSDRDVRATLDTPEADYCVVACPPHPQMGGSRSDPRLQAVSEAVGVACLRFDYGAWDDGHGETEDVRDALAWARSRYETVSLFGYSFGGCLSLVAAAKESAEGSPPSAVSVLSPAASIGAGIDAIAAVPEINAPLGIVYGERDRTVDATAVAEAIEAAGGDVVSLPADHHFVGQHAKVAEAVAAQLKTP